MEDWITGIISQYGPLGIFLLLLLENVFPPIPSEIILTFGGFMTSKGAIAFGGAVAAATLGSEAGALVLYSLGRLLGKKRVEGLVARYGKYMHVRQSDLDRAYGWFGRYQGKTVFFCRMVPLVRSLISIPAGMSRMALGRFLLLTAAGSLLWNTVLIGCGALLGEAWQDILAFLDLYSTITYLVLLGGLAGGCALLYLKRNRRKAGD